MDTKDLSHWRRQRLTGLILIGAGAAFFLDQLGIVSMYDLWHYWPLVLVVVGVVRMIDTPTARDVRSGLWTIFIGVWLFANFEGWFGMDFSSSWPFLLIGWGLTLLLVPVTARRPRARRRNNRENDDAH